MTTTVLPTHSAGQRVRVERERIEEAQLALTLIPTFTDYQLQDALDLSCRGMRSIVEKYVNKFVEKNLYLGNQDAHELACQGVCACSVEYSNALHAERVRRIENNMWDNC